MQQEQWLLLSAGEASVTKNLTSSTESLEDKEVSRHRMR